MAAFVVDDLRSPILETDLPQYIARAELSAVKASSTMNDKFDEKDITQGSTSLSSSFGDTSFTEEKPAPRHDPNIPKERSSSAQAVAVGDEDHDPFSHLPEHESAILRRQLDITNVKVSFKTLFRYATRNDLLIMVLSGISAIIA